MRNISFALTTPQLLDGSKDVTRRLGWENLRAGEVMRAIEKGQGLKAGEKVKPLAHIHLIDVRAERLDRMTTEPDYGLVEVCREGFPDMTPADFVDFFCRSHTGCYPERPVTRIEFKKLPLVDQVFALHMRSQHGSTTGYNIVVDGGKVIGARSAFTPRGKYRDKHPAKTVYTLYEGGQEFDNAVDFLVAYQKQLDGAAK